MSEVYALAIFLGLQISDFKNRSVSTNLNFKKQSEANFLGKITGGLHAIYHNSCFHNSGKFSILKFSNFFGTNTSGKAILDEKIRVKNAKNSYF